MVSQLVKCLSSKHDDLSLMSSTHEKNPGMVASTSNPTAGEVDMDVDH